MDDWLKYCAVEDEKRCGMVKNESQVKLFQNYWNSLLLGPR